ALQAFFHCLLLDSAEAFRLRQQWRLPAVVSETRCFELLRQCARPSGFLRIHYRFRFRFGSAPVPVGRDCCLFWLLESSETPTLTSGSIRTLPGRRAGGLM